MNILGRYQNVYKEIQTDANGNLITSINGIDFEQEGNKIQLPVSSDGVEYLLTGILRELKKMNIYFEILTDEKISNFDVEV